MIQHAALSVEEQSWVSIRKLDKWFDLIVFVSLSSQFIYHWDLKWLMNGRRRQQFLQHTTLTALSGAYSKFSVTYDQVEAVRVRTNEIKLNWENNFLIPFQRVESEFHNFYTTFIIML